MYWDLLEGVNLIAETRSKSQAYVRILISVKGPIHPKGPHTP